VLEFFVKGLINWTGGHSQIGLGTVIGPNATISNSQIGRFCSISRNFQVVRGTHPVHEFVSSSAAFYSINKIFPLRFSKQQLFPDCKYVDKKCKIAITIGSDVFIGAQVMVLEGVKIGDGAVVGAGSVVN